MRDQLACAGKRPHLMIDSNEYWSPKQAIRFISELERHFDLTWVEEPARRWDYRALRQVASGAGGRGHGREPQRRQRDFYPLILNGAVDVVQVGAGTTGITGAMQVAYMDAGFELRWR